MDQELQHRVEELFTPEEVLEALDVDFDTSLWEYLADYEDELEELIDGF